MQTRLPEETLSTPAGQEANDILRRCVHCGFCNATCPTFGLTGNELEGPRGRIYLIKTVLEEGDPSRQTLSHLDSCLGCRACETTCPSGVKFHRLADLGREALQGRDVRGKTDRWRRRFLARFFDGSPGLRFVVAVGRSLRWLLPGRIARLLPEGTGTAPAVDPGEAPRRVLLQEGCVQPTLAPSINAATRRVLARRGLACETATGCCGALAYHLDDVDRAHSQIRRNIDAWHPGLGPSEGLLVTASGCAAFVRDYADLCGDDPVYAAKAREVAGAVRDLSEFVTPPKTDNLRKAPRVAVHLPCTLRHALKRDQALTKLLAASGWQLAETADDGQCCGSAGAYSLLNPATARALRDKKLAQLGEGEAEAIVTANVGCRMHLAGGAEVPVRHWIELWDEWETAGAQVSGRR